MTRTALLENPAVAAPAGLQEALAGLAELQETWHRHCAARLGVHVEEVEVVTELDDEHEVRFEVRLSGPETAERYAEVLAAAQQHAPVLDLVTGGGRAPAGH